MQLLIYCPIWSIYTGPLSFKFYTYVESVAINKQPHTKKVAIVHSNDLNNIHTNGNDKSKHIHEYEQLKVKDDL